MQTNIRKQRWTGTYNVCVPGFIVFIHGCDCPDTRKEWFLSTEADAVKKCEELQQIPYIADGMRQGSVGLSYAPAELRYYASDR